MIVPRQDCLSDSWKRILRRHEVVVFTYGCFDILHAGHVDFLEKARDLGHLLIVGLMSDATAKRMKGPDRPVNYQGYRAMVLNALNPVNYVVIYEEESPRTLIAEIQPEILVMGDNHYEHSIDGSSVVRSYKGKIMTIPIYNGLSTSSILEKIRSPQCS
jgi:rfaE bifunctional protein nucleotidyltransferase chain/domain